MSENLQELFQAAARFYFQRYKEKGGTLGKLSKQLSTSHTYISAVINGSRTASLDLQNKIANSLYGPFDQFIAAGRRLKIGLNPESDNLDGRSQQSIESLIAQLAHYVMHQKKLEKKLKVSEQKFKDISFTSSDIIFELNESLVITYVTGRVNEVVGRNKEELLNKHPYNFLDSNEIDKLKPILDDAIINNRIIDCHIKVRQNGELKYRHVIAKPFFNQDGEFKGIRGTYRDITEKRNLEHAVEEQSWLFESAIDSVDHIAIIITDKNGSILKWNKYYQDLMGYPDEVLETRRLDDHFQYLDDKLADPTAFHKSVEEIKNSSEQIVHFFNLKDGRTIKRTVYPMLRNAILSGRIVHLRDVTEQK